MHDTPIFNYRKALLWIIAISFVLRAFFAAAIQLGNDEVYYWLLAANPAPTYFDHPPMFSWFINLFSFGLAFDSEMAVRMSSLIVFSLNTILIFRIGKELKSERMGFIAALLYQSSIYTFVITGIMILPDTPLSIFWLLAMRSFLIALKNEEPGKREQFHILLAGFFTGLAVISKYHALLLWGGAGAFILFQRRRWFLKPQLYLAAAISLTIILPVVLSGSENVSFQTNRISLFSVFRPLFLMREFFGQLFYNNPVNVILAFVAVFSFKRLKFLPKDIFALLLWFAMPGILIFLFFSLYSATLPHWSAPAYYATIFISAAYLSEMSPKVIPKLNSLALGLLGIVLFLAYAQINYGLFEASKQDRDIENLGKDDVTLDMYGWDRVSGAFMKKSYVKHPATKTIIAHKWYNAAHLDYYLARTNKLKLIALGSPLDIHEYLRINQLRGGLKIGEDAWFIAPSRSFYDPRDLYAGRFEKITPIDTIYVTRRADTVETAVVFYMQGAK